MPIDAYLPRLEAVFDRVVRRLERDFAGQLPGNLTLAQAFALRLLAREGRVSHSRIATVMGVSASAVTSLIERLIEGGHVRREADPDDRRIVWLILSDSGGEVVTGLRQRRREVLLRYLKRLPEADVAALVSIYERLAQTMETEGAIDK